jgi:hypothetical protein
MNDDDPVVLDQRRGMAAQKATELRREIADFRAEQDALRSRQAELEHFLLAAPASCWDDAVEKTRYLLKLLGSSAEGRDPRRLQLIAAVLADFKRLLAESSPPDPSP